MNTTASQALQDPITKIIADQINSVPADVLSHHQWVMYQNEPTPNGNRRNPFTVSGLEADEDDPSTWNSFLNCVEAFKTGKFVGFAYVDKGHIRYHSGDAQTRLKIAAKNNSGSQQTTSSTPGSAPTGHTITQATGRKRGSRPRGANTPTSAPKTTINLLDFDISDLGNAHAVEALYPGQFAYNSAYGWMAWAGTHWDAESSAEARVIQAINATLVERVNQAANSGSMTAHARLINFCTANKGRVQGAEYQLRFLSTVAIDVAEFDLQPDLINTLSGVINLQTKQVYPHDPSQRFTYCVPVHYVPNKDYSEWMELLKKWVPSDQLTALQLMTGYSATGHTREEVLGYLYGPTRSGKGSYTETIGAVLGAKLAAEIEFSTFTEQRKADNQNFDLAPLKPCRVIFASESNEYERLNEAKVKLLTGGNQVRCAFKHRDQFNYRPQFKIWLSSNHQVNADPDDDAVWGRIRIFSFPNSFLGKEDKTLKQQLRTPEMMEQVLAWIVDGAVEWFQLGAGGIQETPSGTLIKSEMRSQLDTLGQWISECCAVDAPYTELNSILYNNYESWCKNNGVTAKKQRAFSQALQKKGYRSQRKSSGVLWHGIKVTAMGSVL